MEAKPYKPPHPFKKLTQEKIDAILKDIEEGSTHKYACEANGVTETIFNVWRNQGRIDIDFEHNTLPAKLVVSMAKIKQKEIKKCRKLIAAAKKGHRGAEWTLEVAYWQDFGKSAEAKELSQGIEQLRMTTQGKENGETNLSEKE